MLQLCTRGLWLSSRPVSVSSFATTTASLWCVWIAIDHPKAMDLTKAERCDRSNRSVMIEKNPGWQTNPHQQASLRWWDRGVWQTGWWRRREIYALSFLRRQTPWWQSFMQQNVCRLDYIHVMTFRRRPYLVMRSQLRRTQLDKESDRQEEAKTYSMQRCSHV